MKSMIAILALLGVASATFYGLYPEQQHFWGPYQHQYTQGYPLNQWYNYKYGQTYPWNTHKSFYPYSKYYHTYPYTTYPYGKEYVPEYIQGQYPVKDETFYKHITTVPGYKHEYPFYPYGQEFYNPIDKYAPFYPKSFGKYVPEYEKFMPTYRYSHMPWFSKYMSGYEKFLPTYEKFVPEYEKFIPTYGYSHMPWFSKYMTGFEKFLPSYEKFVPYYEKFMTGFNKFWPKYEKFVPETVLDTEVVVNTPRVYDFVYPKYTPFWYKYFGQKDIPYQYPTSTFYPKYFEQRPFHYGLY